MGTLDFLNFWDLLGTYSFLATFSNIVSTQQVSKCKSVGLSVMLSPPEPFDEIQPSYSHEWGMQRQIFFGPTTLGPGEGSKCQISFNFNYKVNFKDFYTKLCVCSHK